MQFGVANYCPSCGKPEFHAVSNKEFRCSACSYRYFHNVAAAVAALIVCDGQVLLANRAFEPGKGLFDFPGGFIDPGESFESGLCRELEEELAWQPDPASLRYLFSSFNDYLFADVKYQTLDGFFLIEVPEKPEFDVKDDVSFVRWVDIYQVDESTVAFPPVLEALAKLKTLFPR